MGIRIVEIANCGFFAVDNGDSLTHFEKFNNSTIKSSFNVDSREVVKVPVRAQLHANSPSSYHQTSTSFSLRRLLVTSG
jgi:hypothetical protein